MATGLTMELALVFVGLFLFASVLASKASARLGIPALVLFIALGMLAGVDGPGGIVFDDASLTKTVGSIALACILFAGGMDTDWESIRPVIWRGMSLATLGVFASTFLVGLFANVFLGFTLLEGLLLGAIVSSTDAAAVFGVLRSRSIRLKHRIIPLLEFESGMNDPWAVFLTVGLMHLIKNPDQTPLFLLQGLFTQLPIGFLVGYLAGTGAVWVLNRVRLEYDGLYPVTSIALLCLTYGGAHLVGGNEFLAVYVAGLTMCRRNFLHKVSLIQFHDGVAWLMQIVMFLVLGLLSYPTKLIMVAGAGLALSAFVMFVARPLSVFIALALAHLKTRAKLVIAWAGLRGAVPIILATFPIVAEIPKAQMIFNLVFFVVLTSVIIQGTTLSAVSNWLGIVRKDTELPDLKRARDSELLEVVLSPGSDAIGKMVVQLPLPRTALLVLIKRKGQSYIPKGATVLHEHDVLLIATRREDQDELRAKLQGTAA